MIATLTTILFLMSEFNLRRRNILLQYISMYYMPVWHHSVSFEERAMKNGKLDSSPQAEQAIQRVLQAERDAEQAIQDCENEARQIIHDAQNRAQLINTRVDLRITNMEMRHSHKLDKTIKSIEKEGADELSHDAGNHHDADNLQTVIDQLAIELCLADAATED